MHHHLLTGGPLPDGAEADEDWLLMMVLVDFVEDAGCEPGKASSVEEAIRSLENRTDSLRSRSF